MASPGSLAGRRSGSTCRPGIVAQFFSVDAFTSAGSVCGDGHAGDGEDCDDGDTAWVPGEHCNGQCGALACGDPNDCASITTSDAQFILRASVGSATCSPKVCDVNSNGTVTTTDALLILRKGVGQSVTLSCP